jgi:erythromycin esterase-like protein
MRNPFSSTSHTLVDTLRDAVEPIAPGVESYDALLDLIGDARFVLLGEASHGTHEFYRERARITRHLIERKGFTAVAVEANWPDAYRVHRYVQGRGSDGKADEALADLKRFPTWMWRNTVVRDFVEWLRDHNSSGPIDGAKVGFYGLDLYSLHTSIQAVITYLDSVDPEAARRARGRYSCFEMFGDDPQAYGYQTSFGHAEPCEDEAVAQLVELQNQGGAASHDDGGAVDDERFFAEQNARLAKNAEEYYRSMFRGRVSSWNLRDQHMAEMLDALVEHLERGNQPAKVVVWAHNSHLGDARATEMGEGGELNVGQLVRERYGRDAVLIGFSTYTGTVTAATEWDEPPQRKAVRPGLEGSQEQLFHAVGVPNFLLRLRDRHTDLADLNERRLQRAIGVIYRPETERQSHYFRTRLLDQFDAVLHFDRTHAVVPLDPGPIWQGGAVDPDAPETYPTGL